MADVTKFPMKPASAGVPGAPSTPLPPGFGDDEGGLVSMDVEAFLNMRDWLQAACEAKGAKMTGGGIGCGQADIQIELEGCEYSISIRPRPRAL